jgi:hypothetical protein
MLPAIQMKEHISFTNMEVLNQKGENKSRYFDGILEKVN